MPRNNLNKMIDIDKTEGVFNIFDVTNRGRVMTNGKKLPYRDEESIRYACVCFGYKFAYETPNHIYYKEV